MNIFKLFITNFLVYGLGGIISSVIPFIMLPIVTRIMPSTEYFGISDLSNTVVQFGSAIAIMGMYDAMYRMFFEKEGEDYKKDVCSTTLLFTVISSATVFLLMLVWREKIAKLFFGSVKYVNVVYISAMATLASATNSIVSAPTRMQNKRKVFLVTNALTPILSYSISIPLLLKGHYIIALPLAAVISGVTMEIAFGVMNRSWFHLRRFDGKLLKQMLGIALPLLPNFLIYWLFNSCDKVMITNILGIGAAGVYSAGSKLGQASQLIYMAFAGGWQYFAFSTMNEENQVKTNSLVFEYLAVISFTATAFVCAFSHSIFKLLFPEQYLSAYIVAPYLFMAPLLQMLFQVAVNQFLVVKKTWPNLFILSTGAVLNVVLNFLLIPVMGIEGAALATLVGYFASDIICVIILNRMNLMFISRRLASIAFTATGCILFWRLTLDRSHLGGFFVAILLFSIISFFYYNDLKKLIYKMKGSKFNGIEKA